MLEQTRTMRSMRSSSLLICLMAAVVLTLGVMHRLPDFRTLGLLAVVIVGVGVAVTRLGPQGIAVALLVAGYLSGWLKIWYGSVLGYVMPDALCLLLLAMTLFRGRSSGLPLPKNGLTSAVLLISLFCVLEVVNPLSPFIRSLAGLRSWLLYTWLLFAGYSMLQSRRQIEQFYAIILGFSLVTAAYGLHQWHQGPKALTEQTTNRTLQRYGAAYTWGAGKSGRVFRAFSTYVTPAAFGTNMMLGLLVALVVICRKGGTRTLRYLAISAAPLMAAGLAASGSRAPMVSLVVGMATILFLYRGRAAIPLALLALCGVVAATNLTTSLVGQRFASILDFPFAMQKWSGPLGVGLGIAAKDPFGRGLGYTQGMPWLLSNRDALGTVETTNVDSGIGAAAAELGVIGVLIFLYMLTQLTVCPLRSWRSIPQEELKSLLIAPVAFAITLAVTAVIGSLNAFLPQSIYFWLLIGMVFKAPYLPPEEVAV
jgi:hypothetical protein